VHFVGLFFVFSSYLRSHNVVTVKCDTWNIW